MLPSINDIPTIPNYPKPGIWFRDISPLLQYPYLDTIAKEIYTKFESQRVNVVCGLESRGFIFAPLIANLFKCRFVMIRKPGKLPGKTVSVKYEYEYSSGELHVQEGAIKPNDGVLIVDDVIATGGSIRGAIKLVQMVGGKVVGIGAVLKIRLDSNPKFDVKEYSIYDPYRPVMMDMYPPMPSTDIQTVVLYTPDMNHVIRRIRKDCVRSIIWDAFPDKYPNIRIPDWLRGKDVILVASTVDVNNLVGLASVMRVIPRQSPKSFTVICPYFGAGTMERVEKVGQIATADTVGSVLTTDMQPTQSGPTVFRVCDLHAPGSRWVFKHEGVCYIPDSALPLILEEYDLMRDGLKWAVVFPDEGSYKRSRELIQQLYPKIPFIICAKMRKGNNREISICSYEGVDDINSLDCVLIVDDLMQSGGTLYQCALLFKKMGLKVDAGITHLVAPNREFTKFYRGAEWDVFDNFLVSDSIYQPVEGMEPFRVVSLVEKVVPYDRLNVAITTTSKQKIRALKTLFKIGETFVKESSVSPQPLSREETEKGAGNRLMEYMNCVSIENGIWDGKDRAVIKIRKIIDGKTYDSTLISDGVEVSKDVMDTFEKLRIENPNITVGDVYKNLYGYDSTNWHVKVYGKSRAWLIHDAIRKAGVHVWGR